MEVAGKPGTHGTHGSHGTHEESGVRHDIHVRPDLSWLSRGVPAIFARQVEALGLTRDDIRQIIPDRTLERRITNGENLKTEEADGLARLLRVVASARRVFEKDALADEWLRTANPALYDLIPIQLARTDLGGREVEAVLGRIEHGVFS